MNLIHAVGAVIGATAFVSGCSTQTYAEPPPLAARVSATEAANQIVATHCDYQKECVDPARASETLNACLMGEKSDIDANFAQNPNCIHGVPVADLDHCIAAIKDDPCVSDVHRAGACRSRNLCLE